MLSNDLTSLLSDDYDSVKDLPARRSLSRQHSLASVGCFISPHQFTDISAGPHLHHFSIEKRNNIYLGKRLAEGYFYS